MSVEQNQLHKTTGRSVAEHADDVGADVDAGELIDIIQSRRTADDADDLWLAGDRKIPGFGSELDSCGDEFARFCTDCGSPSAWGQTCYRATCPRCAPSWARRTATSVASQLEQVRRVRQSQKSDHQRFHHISISPPADWNPAAGDADEKWRAGAEVVKDILEASDLEGFVLFHPYRGKSDENDLDDRGEWKRRLFSEKDWSSVRDELKFNPHYHAVVVGHEVPGGGVTRAIESMTGWVIHRITKQDSNVSIYDEYDLARAVSYTLSHAGLYETDEQTRYCHVRAGEKLKPGRGLTWNPDENAEDDRLRREMDAVVRSVAPTTLGLEHNDLACSADHEHDDDHEHDIDAEKVDLDFAQGSRRYQSGSGSGSGSTESQDDASGDLPDRGSDGFFERVDPDDLESMSDDDLPPGIDRDDAADLLDADDDQDESAERCNGRLVSIARAPSYLDDPEWRARAEHADDLEDEYADWSERLDWVG